jgi:hypothetical protein
VGVLCFFITKTAVFGPPFWCVAFREEMNDSINLCKINSVYILFMGIFHASYFPQMPLGLALPDDFVPVDQWHGNLGDGLHAGL